MNWNRASIQAPSLLALLAALLLAGCAPATTMQQQATATRIPTATATPQATVSPAHVTQACGGSIFGATGYYQVGDLYVSVTLSQFAYPSRMIPNGTPLKPLQVVSTQAGFDQQFPEQPYMNPQPSFVVTVCDASTNANDIEGLIATIESVTPDTGVLNAWNYCAGSYSPQNQQPNVCEGPGVGPEEDLNAVFSANAGAGESVTATLVSHNTNYGPPLPLTLHPGRTLTILLNLTPPTRAGYYQFGVRVITNGATSATVPAQVIVLLDPAVRKWSGTACKATAMLAQIPADSMNSYICPE